MAANNLQKNYGHLTLRQLNMWQSTCVRCDFAHQLDQRGYGSLQPFLLFKTLVSPQNSWCSSLFMDIHPPNRRNRSSKSMIFLNMFNVLKTASHPHLHNSQHFTVHPQMSVWTSGFLVCWKVFTWIMQWKNGNWWWNCVPIGSDRLSPPMFRSHPSEHGPMDAHLHFAWQTQGARHYLSQQTKRCLQPATNGMNNSSLSQRDERNFQKLTCLK